EDYRPAKHFGLTRMFSSAVLSGRQLIESSLLVGLDGYSSLGIYSRSTGLGQLLCYKFAFLLMQSVFPVLTKIEQSSDVYNRASGLLLRSVAWIVIPMGVLFSVIADPVIRTIYGEKWVDVIPLLPWAMAAASTGAISYAAYTLLLANQQERHCLAADLCAFAGTIIALVCLVPKGLTSYLSGISFVQLLSLSICLLWLGRARAITIKGVLTAIVLPLVATALTLSICEGFRIYVVNIKGFWTALTYAMAFSATYVAILRLLFAPYLGELVGYLPGGYRLN